MVSLKALRERAGELAKEMRVLQEKMGADDYESNAADEEAWAKVNADYDSAAAQIERADRVDAVTRTMAEPAGDPDVGRRDTPTDRAHGAASDDPDAPATEEHRALAFQGWMRQQSGEDLTEQQEQACQRTGLNPSRRFLDLNIGDTSLALRSARLFRDSHPSMVEDNLARAQQRDLSAVTGSTGGYTVPEGFVNQLEINLLTFGGMMQVADVMRTASGNDLPWPTADDTSNTGVQLSESTSIGSSVDPSIGQIVFKAFKFSSKLIKIPSELMEDSAFNMAAVVGQMLGERLGRITNTKMTTGGGGATPRGLITAATQGKSAASATAIAADELLDLFHSVDPAYRIGARFMMHDSILLAIRKLKDGQGQYLWVSGIALGQADRLLGQPITINQDMASTVEALAKTIAFGQMSKYKIRQVRQIRLRRLVERYADTDQEGFVAFLRQDGDLLDAGTAPVKYLQQAA